MTIAKYTRDSDGLVSYLGLSGYATIDDALADLESLWLDVPAPEVERLLGWPHDAVTWYGSIGYAQGEPNIPDGMACVGQHWYGQAR